MKKNNLIKSIVLLMVSAILSLSSCKKDEGEKKDNIDFKKVGFYIKGSSTSDESLALDAKQVVEPSSDFATKVEREGMWYGIHYLSAGTISFLEMTDDGEVKLGATNTTPVTQEAEAGEAFSYDAGNLKSGDNTSYEVKQKGLYYIMLDKRTSKFWVMQIKNIEIQATGSKAVLISSSKDEATFEAKGVNIKSGFKVRLNTAWKLILDDLKWNESDKEGFAEDNVSPVISYGGSVEVLSADGNDITVDNGGKLLDFSFNWTSGEKGIEGITIVTKEGESLPKTDWSIIKLEVVGSSVSSDNTEAVTDPTWGWGNIIFSNNNTGVPEKSGDTYTYTWNSVVFEAKGTADNQWRIVDEDRKINVNYVDLDIDASSDKVIDADPNNADRNMTFEAKGTYKIVLVIDAADTDKKTLTITEVQ